MILHAIFRIVSHFPSTFHVISRKVDFLWDSVHGEQTSDRDQSGDGDQGGKS